MQINNQLDGGQGFANQAAAAITLAGLGGVPTSRTVNGHALSSNVSVTAGDVGLGSVENTALSTWTGSANLATVGTITAGTWHGSAIADTYISSAPTWNAKVSFPGFGTTAGTAAEGNDVRLSDARTPLAHNQAWSTITSTPTTLSGYGITDAQPLDSDLTSIAALTTTSFGRALLTQADAAATRATIGAVTLNDVPRRGLYSGIMSVAVPTQANTGLTTWVNQGTASATDTPIGLQVVNPTTSSTADNIRGLVMPVPATPYTLTALLELASIAGNFPCALLGWADYESTKTHVVALCGDGRSALVSPTDYSSFVFASAPEFTRDGRRVWLRFSDAGTTITVQWSISGVYWHTLFSKAKASSHLGSAGYNRLFFGASSHSITGVATLLSWSIS